ncbi:MAG: glutamine-hydrolyzing carbamoyl-phosphate synthase small subunit [Rhodospirillales bacterium]
MSGPAPAKTPHPDTTPPPGCDAALVLDDGSVYWGRGFGAACESVGEVCFNTSLTGYQEILTDPSYAGQIITFTFPHIGNVGTNAEDIETVTPAVRGCVLRADITEPSNWRAAQHLDQWLKSMNLAAVAGIDTRKLTRRIRDGGAPNGALVYAPNGTIDVAALQEKAKAWPGLKGMDLAKDVTCAQTYEWDGEAAWSLEHGYAKQDKPKYHVVAVDFGAKRNILRCLAAAGCKVTVVPADTSFDDVMRHKPDGVFFSNGPGDPAATGEYALPMVKAVLESGTPSFGICLGHQLMARALGATTTKMHMGHRGGNHPVKDLKTGQVEITSQNHGFVVERDSLPKNVIETHTSLFDGTLEGIAANDKPVFSVQYHPEASPGPQDSHYLFERFMDLIGKNT